MIISVKGEDIILSKEIIHKTREHFINIHLACIDEVMNGEVKVNDMEKYINWKNESIKHVKAGKSDCTLHFIQVAYFIQTGITVPLLP